jgi:glycosyltransferase involved in cell wall biosynthesis
LIREYGVAPARITVLAPGIDLSRWKPDDHSEREKRNRFSVLFVGGDFVRKGGDSLLRVANDDAFRDMDFHFVTRSFPGNPPGNVRVYSEISPNSTSLMDLYRQCDVFVLPTKADYAPTNAVVEALAFGLPVITTNIGGLGDVIRNGEQGFIFQVDDVTALGQHLRRLKTDAPCLQRLKMNARKLAERDFDVRRNGSRIVDLLQTAAGQQK